MHLKVWATTFLFLIGSAVSNSFHDIAGENDASNLRIIDGIYASAGQYPFMASILSKRSACAGTLIASSYVLTAAHCVSLHSTSAIETRYSRVYLNTLNVAGGGRGSITRFVSKYIVHKNYSNIGTGYVNDIAIIVLDSPVTKVKPVQIAKEKQEPTEAKTAKPTTKPRKPTTKKRALRNVDSYENSNAVIAGWGLTSDEGYSSDKLKAADVQILSNQICAQKWGSLFDASSMMCAEGSTSSICVDDEGGPILVDGSQVGIASFFSSSDQCNDPDSPAVFTRVSAYAAWIAKTMAENPAL